LLWPRLSPTLSNEGSGTVSVIDTSTDAVVGTPCQIGGKPRGAAIGADGRCVVYRRHDQPNNRLVLVDLKERKQAGVIALGVSPEGVGRSPDGRLDRGGERADEQRDPSSTPRPSARSSRLKLQGQNPEHAVFSPDGKFRIRERGWTPATPWEVIDVERAGADPGRSRSGRARAESASCLTAAAPMSPRRTPTPCS